LTNLPPFIESHHLSTCAARIAWQWAAIGSGKGHFKIVNAAFGIPIASPSTAKHDLRFGAKIHRTGVF
jgi:hypothetical protein